MQRVALNVAEQTGVEETLRTLQERRFQAMMAADIPALEQILADDMVYMHASGLTETKQQFLEALKTGRVRYESIQVNEARVRVYGSAAVITGLAGMELTREGQRKSFAFRFTDVYAERNGHWQMVAWQSTRLLEQKKD